WQDGVFVRDDDLRQPRLNKDDERVIAEVEHAFPSKKPWSAHAQAHGRWLGQWIINTLGKNRKSAKRIVDRRIAFGKLAEVAYDPHHHRSGLCTPAQACELARERAAMKRTG